MVIIIIKILFLIYLSFFTIYKLYSFTITDFGNSDVFVIITTQGGRFYIYEYMFAGVSL